MERIKKQKKQRWSAMIMMMKSVLFYIGYRRIMLYFMFEYPFCDYDSDSIWILKR